MSGLEESQINLTPLIDVVFVILIMFIVVAPLLEQDQVELAPTVEHKEAIEKPSRIVLHVKADESITLNHRPVNKAQLKRLLDEAHRRFPQEEPQLYHDKRATFGSYQEIKNLLAQAGFERLDVLLLPES